jgi:hypothetical protein
MQYIDDTINKWGMENLVVYSMGKQNNNSHLKDFGDPEAVIGPPGSIANEFHSISEIEEGLRNEILNRIRQQGFKLSPDNKIEAFDMESKDLIRKVHAPAKAERLIENKKFLAKNEDKLIRFFASGKEIEIENFRARIEVVASGTIESDLFRYATLLWSVPVSNGFGRRVKFLVWDENIGKLVGIFALGDPVFNLACRDNLIGWDWNTRCKHLYNVMDVFILGAVPPYNRLLGGKLVAMTATSNEVRNIIRKRYSKSTTVITKEEKDSRLALLTTSSALGKSSLYDRIKYRDIKLFNKIGCTEGYGHFHLNNGLFEEMRHYLDIVSPGMASKYRFGNGPNWKMRTARNCLNKLGLPGDLLKHGIKREVYAIPLARNYAEFLRGDSRKLDQIDIPFNDVVDFWKERWLYGRVERVPDYLSFENVSIRSLVRGSDERNLEDGT